MQPRKAPPPPSGRPMISKEVVDAVKKKVSAPTSAPPAGLASIMANIKKKTEKDRLDEKYDIDNKDNDDDDDELFDVEGYGGQKMITSTTSSSQMNKQPNTKPNESKDFKNITHQAKKDDFMDENDENDGEEEVIKQPQPLVAAAKKTNNHEVETKHLNDRNNTSTLGVTMNRPIENKELESKQENMWAVPVRSNPLVNNQTVIQTELNNNDNNTKMLPRKKSSLTDLITLKSTGKTPIFKYTQILKASPKVLKDFVTSPCQPGVIVRCYIERSRSGGNMFAPLYSLCADLDDGTGRELMVCRKVIKSRTPHYVFSMTSDDLYKSRNERGSLYLGKLRGRGSEYILYDNGDVSKDGDDDGDESDDGSDDPNPTGSGSRRAKTRRNSANDTKNTEENTRKELAAIYYNLKKRPAPLSVRGSEICIPGVSLLSLEESDMKAEAKDSTSSMSEMGVADVSYEMNPSPNLLKTFQKIIKAGKQNEMSAEDYFVMHERTTRYP